MYIIGISGKKRSGKDTAADEILKQLPGGFKIAFADALKCEVAAAVELPVSNIEEHKAVFRPMLQWWGTEFRRQHGGNPNYWVEQVARAINYAKRHLQYRYVVITDVRFNNEYEFVKSLGGMVIRIESNRCPVSADPHPSETELDGAQFDLTIQSNDTIEKFRDDVANFAIKVIGQRVNPDLITLDTLVAEVNEWGLRNFPTSEAIHPLLGMFEEHGEYLAAQDREAEEDAIADLTIYVANYCGKESIPMTVNNQCASLAVELGKLAHYHLKGSQGIRYTPEQIREFKVAQVAKVVGAIQRMAISKEINWLEAVGRTWAKVKKRNWVTNPINAAAIAEGGAQ